MSQQQKKEKLDEIINDLNELDWFYGQREIIKKLEKFKEEEL